MKLDGLGSVDNRPSSDKLHNFVAPPQKKIMKKILTCDMWHRTCDVWHMKWGGGWTFSQKFSSIALTVCDLWYYADLEEKADWLTDRHYKSCFFLPGKNFIKKIVQENAWKILEKSH